MARLEVELDPRPAQSGARTVKRSLEEVAAAADRMEQRMAQAAQRAGSANDNATKSISARAAAVARLTAAEARLGDHSAYADRAADIAAYGAEMDRLRAKFNPVFAASQRYEQSLNEINRAHSLGAINAHEQAAAIDQLNNAYRRAAMAANTYETAANSVYGRDGMLAAQASPANVAAQFQDIGVTAAMGMNPLLIGLQQGTQLSMAFSSGVKELGAAFAVLLGPVALATIATVTLGAALLQMVDWIWVGQAALNGLATAIEAIGPYAIYAAGTLALIYSRAILSGIAAVTVSMTRLGWAAMRAAASFTAAWLAAIGPAGWVILGFAAVVTAANIFRDELAQIFGVDVVGAAKDAANKVIAFFVGAYNYITSTFADLPAMFSALGKKSINALIDEVSNVPLLTLPGGFEWKVDFSGQKLKLNDREKAAMSGLNGSIGDVQKDYLGDFGGAISRGASTAADKLRELAAGLGEVEEKTKKGKSEAEKMADRYDDIVRGARQFISAQELERQSIGMTEQAANRLRYEQDLLNQAANDNIALTPAQAAELKGLASSMAEAEAHTNALRSAFEFAKDATTGFMRDFRSGIEQGKGVIRSLGDAALGVLDKISDKLIDMAVNNLWSNAMGGASGGGGFLGNILGGLGSIFGGGGQFAIAQGGGIGLYQSGGYTGSGAADEVAGLVHRNEVVWSQRDVARAGGVEAVERMRRGMERNNNQPMPANGNSGGSLKVDVGVTVDDEGKLQAYVKSISRKEAGSAVSAYDTMRQKRYNGGGQFG